MVEQTPTDANREPERKRDQIDILFEAALRTFDWSVARSRHFDIKASIILAFLGILLLPSLEIWGWSNKLPELRLAPIVLVFAGIVFCLYAVLPTPHLEHPNLPVLEGCYERDRTPLESKLELFRYYEGAAKRNEDVGKRKIRLIQAALASSFFAFVFVLIQYIARGCLYGR